MRTPFHCAGRLSFFLLALLLTNSSFAQDLNSDSHTITVTLPSVAILDIEPAASKNIAATFVAPTEAGDPLVAPSANTDLWLNYSSILSAGVTSRKVEVALTLSGSEYDGLAVKLLAGAATTGGGQMGTPGAQITLSATNQDLITGIGSAYTVTGANSGHQLTYSFETVAGAYENLTAGDRVLTVTYTLTDVN